MIPEWHFNHLRHWPSTLKVKMHPSVTCYASRFFEKKNNSKTCWVSRKIEASSVIWGVGQRASANFCRPRVGWISSVLGSPLLFASSFKCPWLARIPITLPQGDRLAMNWGIPRSRKLQIQYKKSKPDIVISAHTKEHLSQMLAAWSHLFEWNTSHIFYLSILTPGDFARLNPNNPKQCKKRIFLLLSVPQKRLPGNEIPVQGSQPSAITNW